MVIFAGVLPSTWGNVVIIKHSTEPVIYSRSAHLDSFIVQKGQQVSKNQKIGNVGNAFGTLPYHLHYDLSLTNILESIPGHWPGGNLDLVRQHYVEPRALTLISQSGFTNKQMIVKSAANFRAGPKTSFRVYETLLTGTKVTVLGLVDEFNLVKVGNYYGFIHSSLLQESLPVGTTRLGLHASADPGNLPEGEFQLFKTAKVEVIKVLSAHSPQSISRLANENLSVPFIIRAFLDWGNRVISPQEFFDWTFPDVQRSVTAVGAGREIWVELHNEPNLPSEGLGFSWQDGKGFNDWLLQVLGLYKNALQGVLFMYPGLSPQFTAYRPFLADSMASALACDGAGVHTYWSNTYSMEQALIDTVDWYVQKFGNKPLWLTEASQNKCGVTATQKGLQYITFRNELRKRPLVKGVTYFVASASNPAFRWGTGGSCETWNNELAGVVGSRQS